MCNIVAAVKLYALLKKIIEASSRKCQNEVESVLSEVLFPLSRNVDTVDGNIKFQLSMTFSSWDLGLPWDLG